MSTPETVMVTDHQSPWTRPWFLLAAAFVAILVALGVYLVATGPDNHVAAAPTAAATSGPSPATTPDTAGDTDASVCGLAAGDQMLPTLAPQTTWALVGRVAAPASPSAGPGVIDDGFRYCYAHSPEGAVFAAANDLVMSQSPEHMRRATKDLMAPGRGRDILLESQNAASDEDLRTGLADSTLQVAGFRVQDYADDQAVVVMAFRTADGTLASFPMVMQWSGGDWKQLLSPTGGAEGQIVPDLTGLTPWSGV